MLVGVHERPYAAGKHVPSCALPRVRSRPRGAVRACLGACLGGLRGGRRVRGGFRRCAQ